MFPFFHTQIAYGALINCLSRHPQEVYLEFSSISVFLKGVGLAGREGRRRGRGKYLPINVNTCMSRVPWVRVRMHVITGTVRWLVFRSFSLLIFLWSRPFERTVPVRWVYPDTPYLCVWERWNWRGQTVSVCVVGIRRTKILVRKVMVIFVACVLEQPLHIYPFLSFPRAIFHMPSDALMIISLTHKNSFFCSLDGGKGEWFPTWWKEARITAQWFSGSHRKGGANTSIPVPRVLKAAYCWPQFCVAFVMLEEIEWIEVHCIVYLLALLEVYR